VSSALEAIGAYVDRHWSSLDTPGLALGLTDRARPLATIVRGWANIDASSPVQPGHRFQIGSISKGFTAMAVLREVEAGRIDLDAPVTDYLPWFLVPSRFERPVTIHHLLSHTGGLACGLDSTGDVVGELLLLLETEIGSEPGTRFRYSNAGYKALGLVLEAVSGRPWWESVHERVMVPIGMGEADVIITNDVRQRLTVGYTAPFDDRPWVPEHGWTPSVWCESATADGTICATAEELAAYARLLLMRGHGVLAEPSFARMTARVAEDPEARGHVYGYGVKWIEGDRLLGHSGSMLGFTAYLVVDVIAGFGTTVLMNSAFGGYRLELARFALACLAAEAAGEPMPEIPPPSEREPWRVPAGGDGNGPPRWEAFAGRYRSWNPWAPILQITERDGRLWASLVLSSSDWGDEERALLRLADGRYRPDEEGSPDRLRFEAFVNGKAVRAVLDGAAFTRAVV